MRDYDPTTGRYIQGDPLGLVDGPSVYGYALQNPERYIDPRGEQSLRGPMTTAPGGGRTGPMWPGEKYPGQLGEGLMKLFNPIPLVNWLVDICTPDVAHGPDGPPYHGANKCTLISSKETGKDKECHYACKGPPPYWNVVHIPSGASCPITYWD